MRLLLLDNHDSFTWNLVELLRATGKVTVKICTPEQFHRNQLFDADRIMISPGPGLPQEQPVLSEILSQAEQSGETMGRPLPVFGVCLGLQAIALYFGGSLCNLDPIVHGQPKQLIIRRSDHFLFNGIPDRPEAGLYHSWAVDPETLPDCLDTLATTTDGTIMALAHKTLPICGVQFHPESIMTPMGRQMVQNWLEEEA
jgi:anthranilate synthase/aminodeoxychorismate synthase-like glutamine amidotransferase